MEHGFGVLGGTWNQVLGCWEGPEQGFGVLQEDLWPGFGVLGGHGTGFQGAGGLQNRVLGY